MKQLIIFTLILCTFSISLSAQTISQFDSIETTVRGILVKTDLKVTRNSSIGGALQVGTGLTVNNGGLDVNGGLNLNTGILNVGDKSGNANMNLQYNSASGKAQFGFIKGNAGTTINNAIDAFILKESSGPMSFITITAEPIHFNTAAITRMIISGTGNIGIGAAPSTTDILNVNGSTKLGGNVGVGTDLKVGGITQIDGNVGIGTPPSVGERLSVLGQTRLSGNVGIGAAPTTTETLFVDGKTFIHGQLDVTNGLSVTGKASVTGDGHIGGNADVTGNLALTGQLNVTNRSQLMGNVGIGAASGTEKLIVDGTTRITGNVGIGTLVVGPERLNVAGTTKLGGDAGVTGALSVTSTSKLDGNVGIGSAPTTDKLNVLGNTKLNGDLTITGNTNFGTGKNTFGTPLPRVAAPAGTAYSTSENEQLTLGGNLRISGSNPKIHLEGDAASLFPEIFFSGYDIISGEYRPEYTKISGYGGLTITTTGFISSLAKGTTALTSSKSLHTYQAENWSGFAQVGSIGLYGGNTYANSIDFISSTRIKVKPADYTGGLIMGYSPVDPAARDFGAAASVKAQYMGTDINAPSGQHKFDMVFAINSEDNGNKAYEPLERMRIKHNGQVNIPNSLAIGAIPVPPGYKLAVKGQIIAEGVTITPQANWPDYVFDKGYKLRPLSKVEKFIKENGHLPEIPKAADVEKNGFEVGSMNVKLLEKIEELTLYLINQQKQIDELKKEVKQLKKK